MNPTNGAPPESRWRSALSGLEVALPVTWTVICLSSKEAVSVFWRYFRMGYNASRKGDLS